MALSTHNIESFRPLLKALTLSASLPPPVTSFPSTGAPFTRSPGPALTSVQLESLFQHLADPAFTSDATAGPQIGAALTALRLTGTDATAEALAIASRVFLQRCIHVDLPELAPSLRAGQSGVRSAPKADDEEEDEPYEGALDLVGTGGDGHDTFNVSTTAAIVAAGVPGCRICKHGAKASSSTSGSADLLLSLGIPLLTLSPSSLPEVLPNVRFAFLFAQLYHPSLAPLGPIRRTVGTPTIFNVLGPLINPARPKRCILGVHSYGLGEVYAIALRETGVERAWVVCGREGLDEISPEGPTDVWELRAGRITHFSITPADFGLPSHPLDHVRSATSAENASVVLHLLRSSDAATLPVSLPTEPLSAALPLQDATDATRNLPPIPAGTRLSALRDYTLLQSSALLHVAGRGSLKGCVELARKSMEAGGARDALETFRRQATKAVEEMSLKQGTGQSATPSGKQVDDVAYASVPGAVRPEARS